MLSDDGEIRIEKKSVSESVPRKICWKFWFFWSTEQCKLMYVDAPRERLLTEAEYDMKNYVIKESALHLGRRQLSASQHIHRAIFFKFAYSCICSVQV